MKILCVIDSLGSGGAQRQLVELAKGFKEKGHEVSFLVYHPQNFYKEELLKANIEITYINESSYFKRLFKMRRFIRRGEFDGVLSFLEAANFISTVAGFPYRKWKLVVGERSANPNILKSFKLRFYRYFHVFADYVVANSQTNIDMVKKINPLLNTRKCLVIYNFTNMEANNMIEEHSYSKKLIVTIPASYRKVKNIDGLIDGLNLLTDNYREKLIINWFGRKDTQKGSDYYNEAIQKINKYNLENVVFLNDVSSNIHEEYMKSDFVALLSHYEGFPNAICEAMAIGKPVITSRASDLSIIIKEGENGFLCDSQNPETIKNAFVKALDSSIEERKHIKARNIKKANLLFNKSNAVEAYIKILST